MDRRCFVLVGSLLVACSSARTVEDEPGFDPAGDDAASGDVTSGDGDPNGDDGGGPMFDVSSEINTGDVLDPEASCAKTEAAAIKPPVDIIFAIDTSGSMDKEIIQIKSNILKLSTYLAGTGLDYRVVMIATKGTSTYAVCVPEPLAGPNCSSSATLRVVEQYVSSTNAFANILTTYDVMPPNVRAWRDFLRKDALKVIVPVTDDNSSMAWASFDTALQMKSAEQFGNATKRNFVVYPIMGANKFPAETKCTTSVNTGSVYITAAKATGGKWWPVCDADYGPIFTEMAKDIATSVACELVIPPPPMGQTLDPNKVNVTYTPGSGGATEPILKDESKPCDAGAVGWQYNADKTKVLLCGDACAKVKADPAAKVNVEFGCATVVKPPT